MAVVLTRGLTTVRTEFDEAFPGRDKDSDGWVGDLAHQDGPSGHNPDKTGRPEYADGDLKDEVRAIDVDKDLVPGSPVDWMEMAVQSIVKRGRAGTYVPFRYLIYKSRIWARSDGWRTRTYTGANKHDKHAHFSGDYTQNADEWTGSLGLRGLTDVPLDNADVKKIWDYPLNINVGSGPANPQLVGGIVRYMDHRAERSDNLVKALAAKMDALIARVGVLDTREAAEVPPSADVIALAVTRLINAMPDVTVNVDPADLRAAIVGAIHEISVAPTG